LSHVQHFPEYLLGMLPEQRGRRGYFRRGFRHIDRRTDQSASFGLKDLSLSGGMPLIALGITGCALDAAKDFFLAFAKTFPVILLTISHTSRQILIRIDLHCRYLLYLVGLSRVCRTGPAVDGTAGKINRLAAAGAAMRPVELVGENLFGLTAFRAAAFENTPVPQLFESGAMLGSGRLRHHVLLLWSLTMAEPSSSVILPAATSIGADSADTFVKAHRRCPLYCCAGIWRRLPIHSFPFRRAGAGSWLRRRPGRLRRAGSGIHRFVRILRQAAS